MVLQSVPLHLLRGISLATLTKPDFYLRSSRFFERPDGTAVTQCSIFIYAPFVRNFFIVALKNYDSSHLLILETLSCYQQAILTIKSTFAALTSKSRFLQRSAYLQCEHLLSNLSGFFVFKLRRVQRQSWGSRNFFVRPSVKKLPQQRKDCGG